jgi:hypothetical protein
VCGSSTDIGVAGNVKVKWLRIFTHQTKAGCRAPGIAYPLR